MKDTERAAQTVELSELFVGQPEPCLALHNTGLWQSPRLTGDDLELHQIKFMSLASDYAGKGFFVIPQLGKRPLIPNWVKLATKDPEQIKRWWEERPDAELGIATGHGLAVLDIDPRNDGFNSLEALQERHGKLPQDPDS